MLLYDLKLDIVKECALQCDIFYRNFLFGQICLVICGHRSHTIFICCGSITIFITVIIIEDIRTIKINLVLINFHHLCTKLTDFLLKLLAGFHYCHTGSICSGRSIRS